MTVAQGCPILVHSPPTTRLNMSSTSAHHHSGHSGSTHTAEAALCAARWRWGGARHECKRHGELGLKLRHLSPFTFLHGRLTHCTVGRRSGAQSQAALVRQRTSLFQKSINSRTSKPKKGLQLETLTRSSAWHQRALSQKTAWMVGVPC